MWWRRVRFVLLGVAISAALPVAGAAAQETPPAEAPETRPADEEEATLDAELESGVEVLEGLEAGGDADDSDSDSDSDSDHPARLIVSVDDEANIWVDGDFEGRAEPGEPLEFGVDLGEIELRATSVRVPGAIWEETVEVTEAGAIEKVRVKMKRTIRQFRKDERKTGVYRDSRTNLMWAKRDNGRDVDLRRAYAHCRDLQTGGFDNWRLPTLQELKSLEAIWSRSTYKIQGGILLTECCMWSSEYDGTGLAWTFNFRFRQKFQTNAGYEIGLRALCVREWDPESEPDEETEESEG